MSFRKKNTTIYVLIERTEKIKVFIDSGKFGCGIFIELKKSFNTVNHSILLKNGDEPSLLDLIFTTEEEEKCIARLV